MFRSSKLRKPPKEKKARFFKPSSSSSHTKETANTGNTTSTNDVANPPAAPQPISMKNNGFSHSELQEFQESFALFDTERVGSISAVELRTILESLQDRRNMPHLDKLLKELATCSEEDRLEFDDYVALMERTSLHQTLQQEESDETANFSHVFQLFDVEQKGYISIQDLKRAAIELGEYDITQDELEEMIERAQSSHQGRVYLPEFSRIMNLNLFHKLEQDASVA